MTEHTVVSSQLSYGVALVQETGEPQICFFLTRQVVSGDDSDLPLAEVILHHAPPATVHAFAAGLVATCERLLAAAGEAAAADEPGLLLGTPVYPARRHYGVPAGVMSREEAESFLQRITPPTRETL
jgi:hypothetical protein